MAKYFNYFPTTYYSNANNVTTLDTVTNIIARFQFEGSLKDGEYIGVCKYWNMQGEIISEINYPEIKTIENSDINYDAPIYEANVLGIATLICIGQPNYTFAQSNQIVYYSIYLMKNDKVVSKIGLYEVFEDTLPTLLDDVVGVVVCSPNILSHKLPSCLSVKFINVFLERPSSKSLFTISFLVILF